MISDHPKIDILGLPVDSFTLEEFVENIVERIRAKARTTVMYLNVHVVNQTFQNPRLKEILKKADILYCDGGGIIIGARILGKKIPRRMTGADWIYDLSEVCCREHISLYFLGGQPGVAKKAAGILREKYPTLDIRGCCHGYFDRAESRVVIDKINGSKPDILFIGFGTPIQELWLDQYRASLDVPVCWAVGAVVDFISETVPRGPRWMLDNNLEWLYRLLIEPRRMWRRYLIGNTRFLIAILLQRCRLIKT